MLACINLTSACTMSLLSDVECLDISRVEGIGDLASALEQVLEEHGTRALNDEGKTLYLYLSDIAPKLEYDIDTFWVSVFVVQKLFTKFDQPFPLPPFPMITI